MTESMNKERMNTIFQESKIHGLMDPEPGVDPRGNFTLTWTVRETEIKVIFTPALYMTVSAGETMVVDFNVATETDSEIIDRVEKAVAAAS